MNGGIRGAALQAFCHLHSCKRWIAPNQGRCGHPTSRHGALHPPPPQSLRENAPQRFRSLIHQYRYPLPSGPSQHPRGMSIPSIALFPLSLKFPSFAPPFALVATPPHPRAFVKVPLPKDTIHHSMASHPIPPAPHTARVNKPLVGLFSGLVLAAALFAPEADAKSRVGGEVGSGTVRPSQWFFGQAARIPLMAECGMDWMDGSVVWKTQVGEWVWWVWYGLLRAGWGLVERGPGCCWGGWVVVCLCMLYGT